ncbi:TrkH family potassium uptake protein [Yoonia sediminilitoris]|uniref:Trk system potassium uptake protein TrkH n=1 Tax=Yoonia sediminilitoris TaxID=1286148 RepID=A0A2T6KS58_9RHOB|nr:potassium transporter TrkG [Yoonia sediminilitoris]PUB19393.1 trk system potassium uptake protein TrkH [Yoonia sediminilitoris]RCW99561.1 trk system potassium uptake protein TrkH [Yoonia sediminilitoris]
MDWITRLPLFVVLMGIGACAMLVPALHGVVMEDFGTMRIFFYGFILFSILTLMIGLATVSYARQSVARSQLVALLAAFTVLPLMFALPFYEAVPNTTFLNAWFEMVSSFTTTGATVYDTAGRLTPSQHLWRALVGWMGGLLMWITAVSIFAPMNLGGFEVRAAANSGSAQVGRYRQFSAVADPSERLMRYAATLTPIYTGLTLLLWLGLVIAGEFPYIALCHAMSVLATSGISPIGGLYFAASGFWGELLIFLFFVFALSRLTFSKGLTGESDQGLRRDPEFRTALVLIGAATAMLFLRHFVGAAESDADFSPRDIANALWGALFTTTSFLTTSGFESRFWEGAAVWSGLRTPGLFLIGMALIGGGVATTAGGVKLLRIYALYRHGEREQNRLLYPSSIGGGGKAARRIRKQGAYISWIFFMLFALSIALVVLMLSLTGVQFETSMVLAVSALSTTGPLATVAAEAPIAYSGLPDAAKLVLAGAMVLGRLETLAIIALFNPEIWQR